MTKQKVGLVLFWLGVVGVLINFLLTYISASVYKVNTPETMIGTGWAPGESLYALSGLVMLVGFSFILIGPLLYSGKKGSFFWLWALVPIIGMNVGMLWHPSQQISVVFGIGAGIITLAYIGVLWAWVKNHTVYEGIAKTGKHIQLLGYSFLYITALFLCSYIGNPTVPGMANIPIVSSTSIMIAFSVGWVLLSVGHYLSGKGQK
jgi:hypothetical protein